MFAGSDRQPTISWKKVDPRTTALHPKSQVRHNTTCCTQTPESRTPRSYKTLFPHRQGNTGRKTTRALGASQRRISRSTSLSKATNATAIDCNIHLHVAIPQATTEAALNCACSAFSINIPPRAHAIRCTRSASLVLLAIWVIPSCTSRVDLHGERLKAACANSPVIPSTILHVALGIGMAHSACRWCGACRVLLSACRCYRKDGTVIRQSWSRQSDATSVSSCDLPEVRVD